MEAEQPTRNEQTPTAPRRSREDAFKDLLLKLSHNLADNDVDGLKFLDEIKLLQRREETFCNRSPANAERARQVFAELLHQSVLDAYQDKSPRSGRTSQEVR